MFIYNILVYIYQSNRILLCIDSTVDLCLSVNGYVLVVSLCPENDLHVITINNYNVCYCVSVDTKQTHETDVERM